MREYQNDPPRLLASPRAAPRRWTVRRRITGAVSRSRLLQGPGQDGRTVLRCRVRAGSLSYGLDLAREAGELNNEGKNLVGLAIAAVRFQIPEASAVCQEAITRLYETRHWSLVWIAVDLVACWLAAASKVEVAAVVYGHFEVLHPVFGQTCEAPGSLAWARDRTPTSTSRPVDGPRGGDRAGRVHRIRARPTRPRGTMTSATPVRASGAAAVDRLSRRANSKAEPRASGVNQTLADGAELAHKAAGWVCWLVRSGVLPAWLLQ